MKICSKCKAEKPVKEFHKKPDTKDGLQNKCKSCVSDYDARYRQENAEKEAARYKDRYAKDPEKKKEARREYYRSNSDKCKASIVKWNTANPEKYAAMRRNRRARVSAADGSHSGADILAIFGRQRGMCASCSVRLLESGKQKYHVDHVMPLSLGGSNWPDNLQCLCPPCNLRKNAKHPLAWANENGKLL